MSHLFGKVIKNVDTPVDDDQWREVRLTPSGAILQVPWVQALVFEGVVFGFQFGSVSTGINGHAAVDPDQPEIAINIPDGIAGLPLQITASAEGTTTLGALDLLAAVSDVLSGAGTSTAGTAVNLRLDAPRGPSASVYHTFSGNGTDILTAAHHLELQRVHQLVDTDAATSGLVFARLDWSALTHIAPVILDGGTIGVFVEGQAAACSGFATPIWAELSESAFQ